MKTLLVILSAIVPFAVSQPWDCDMAGGLYSAFYHCNHLVEYDDGEGTATRLGKLCGEKMPAFKQCFRDACFVDDMSVLNGWLRDYSDRVCDNTDIKPAVLYLKKRYECIFKESECTCEPPWELCNYWDNYDLVETCYHRVGYGEYFNTTFAPHSMEEAIPFLKRYGKELLRCIRHRTDFSSSCGEKERNAIIYYHLSAHIPPGIPITFGDARARRDKKDSWGPRTTVTAFGDPHMTSYKSRDVVTCGSANRTTFVMHDEYVNVEGNNKVVNENGATLIDQLMIEVFKSDGSVVGVYDAKKGQLPLTFTDGSDVLTVGDDEVTVRKFKDNAMQITHRGGAFAIVIARHLPGEVYVTLSLRMPNILLDEASGLLVGGCEDIISRADAIARRKRSTDCSACDDGDKDEILTEACHFDCQATGDVQLALASDPTDLEDALLQLDAEMDNSGSDLIGIHTGFILGLALILSLINQ